MKTWVLRAADRVSLSPFEVLRTPTLNISRIYVLHAKFVKCLKGIFEIFETLHSRVKLNLYFKLLDPMAMQLPICKESNIGVHS